VNKQNIIIQNTNKFVLVFSSQEIAGDAEHWNPPGGGPQAIKMAGY